MVITCMLTSQPVVHPHFLSTALEIPHTQTAHPVLVLASLADAAHDFPPCLVAAPLLLVFEVSGHPV